MVGGMTPVDLLSLLINIVMLPLNLSSKLSQSILLSLFEDENLPGKGTPGLCERCHLLNLHQNTPEIHAALISVDLILILMGVS